MACCRQRCRDSVACAGSRPTYLASPWAPALVSAKLAAGTIETDVVEMPVSQGTLRMVPHVYLNNEPPLVTVDAGQILTDVSISPGMCQGWLKYVAPLAADATRAEGKFSLSLERAAIPLERPATAQVQGTLLVDSARIGPGPLARQLIDLSEQVEALVRGRLPSSATRESITWVSIPQQRTRFQVVDGRVHHDRFELHIDNAVVYTRGSVGFDQSLGTRRAGPVTGRMARARQAARRAPRDDRGDSDQWHAQPTTTGRSRRSSNSPPRCYDRRPIGCWKRESIGDSNSCWDRSGRR